MKLKKKRVFPLLIVSNHKVVHERSFFYYQVKTKMITIHMNNVIIVSHFTFFMFYIFLRLYETKYFYYVKRV